LGQLHLDLTEANADALAITIADAIADTEALAITIAANDTIALAVGDRVAIAGTVTNIAAFTTC